MAPRAGSGAGFLHARRRDALPKKDPRPGTGGKWRSGWPWREPADPLVPQNDAAIWGAIGLARPVPAKKEAPATAHRRRLARAGAVKLLLTLTGHYRVLQTRMHLSFLPRLSPVRHTSGRGSLVPASSPPCGNSSLSRPSRPVIPMAFVSDARGFLLRSELIPCRGEDLRHASSGSDEDGFLGQ